MDSSAQSCFVMMPISDQPNYDLGHFGHIYRDIIKPAIEKAGYRSERADETSGTNMIHHEILKSIVSAPMSVCDLSSRNPNVMFELGMRQAFDMPVVIIQDELTPPIFDVSGLRTITYRGRRLYDEVIADQQKIEDAIRATAEQNTSGQSVNSLVRLLQIEKAIFDPSLPENPERSAVQFLQYQMDGLSEEFRNLAGYIQREMRRLPRAEKVTASELATSALHNATRRSQHRVQLTGWGRSAVDPNDLIRSIDPLNELVGDTRNNVIQFLDLPTALKEDFLKDLSNENGLYAQIFNLRIGLDGVQAHSLSYIAQLLSIHEEEADRGFNAAIFFMTRFVSKLYTKGQ